MRTAGRQGDKDGLLILRYYGVPSNNGTDRLIIQRPQKHGGPVRARFCPVCGVDVSGGWPADS